MILFLTYTLHKARLLTEKHCDNKNTTNCEYQITQIQRSTHSTWRVPSSYWAGRYPFSRRIRRSYLSGRAAPGKRVTTFRSEAKRGSISASFTSSHGNSAKCSSELSFTRIVKTTSLISGEVTCRRMTGTQGVIFAVIENPGLKMMLFRMRMERCGQQLRSIEHGRLSVVENDQCVLTKEQRHTPPTSFAKVKSNSSSLILSPHASISLLMVSIVL